MTLGSVTFTGLLHNRITAADKQDIRLKTNRRAKANDQLNDFKYYYFLLPRPKKEKKRLLICFPVKEMTSLAGAFICRKVKNAFNVCTEYKTKLTIRNYTRKSRKEIPQKLAQLCPRSHPRHLVGKRTAQKTPSKTSPATAR